MGGQWEILGSQWEVKKWSKIVRNGPGWSEMVQKGPRFRNSQIHFSYIPIFDGLVNVERGDDDYDRYLDEKHRWSGKKDGMI